ncbi:MAG: ABC transporter permease [Candidatus Methanofastidiosia archaeon]
MLRSPVLFIAAKELASEKRKLAILVLAISAGVMTYIVFDAMFAGWGDDILSKTIDIWTSHMKVLPSEDKLYVERVSSKVSAIEALPKVESAAARIIFASFVKSKSKQRTALFLGIQPDREKEVTTIHEKMIFGEFLTDKDKNKVILGSKLARDLKIDMGERLTVIFPNGEVRELKVKGIFNSGYYEFDYSFVLIPYDTVTEVFGVENVASEIIIRFENEDDVEDALIFVQGIAPTDNVKSWKVLAAYVLAMLKAEGMGSNFTIIIIVLTAAFAMGNGMIMKISDRTGYIGIMKAIGGRGSFILKVYLLESILIGMTGAFLGEFLGFLVVRYLKVHPFVFEAAEEIYGTTVFPVAYNPPAFLFGLAFAVGICVIAGLYPSIKASRLNPVEAMRHV